MTTVPVISILDDDVSVRIAISRLVRSMGYLPRAFVSADEFLKSQLMDDSRCVIADVQMPGMTGIDLQELLRSQGRYFPIIFITGLPEDQLQARALKNGAVCVLRKPFDGAVLIDCIGTALRQNGTRLNRP